MPITADRKHLYPPDWKQISARIRFVRAEGRCECVGECGLHKGRCKRRHGHVEYREKWDGGHIETREVKIVLTVAHRIHGSDCSDANLFAACQSCHLNYDAKMHASNRRISAAHKAGQFNLLK